MHCVCDTPLASVHTHTTVTAVTRGRPEVRGGAAVCLCARVRQAIGDAVHTRESGAAVQADVGGAAKPEVR